MINVILSYVVICNKVPKILSIVPRHGGDDIVPRTYYIIMLRFWFLSNYFFSLFCISQYKDKRNIDFWNCFIFVFVFFFLFKIICQYYLITVYYNNVRIVYVRNLYNIIICIVIIAIIVFHDVLLLCKYVNRRRVFFFFFPRRVRVIYTNDVSGLAESSHNIIARRFVYTSSSLALPSDETPPSPPPNQPLRVRSYIMY